MKQLSLDPVFLPGNPATPPRGRAPRTPADEVEFLRSLPFTEAYDTLRSFAREAIAIGEPHHAVTRLSNLALYAEGLPDADELPLADLRAAIMQVLTALYIETGDNDTAAASAAASTLQMLARTPRRKDRQFLEVLGSLLYDIACLHSSHNEYKQAEREMEKALKVFERLGKLDSQRYAATIIAAMAGATGVYNNRVRQAELLAHYQAVTTTYTRMVAAGVADATDRLVDSLANEGDTLSDMGKHRDAIQYYSRALKYLQRLEPDTFTVRQLHLSVSLGSEMLLIPAMREKGIHLLNTMLHKAHKLNAPDEYERISQLLDNARSSRLDILSFWHKIFPK